MLGCAAQIPGLRCKWDKRIGLPNSGENQAREQTAAQVGKHLEQAVKVSTLTAEEQEAWQATLMKINLEFAGALAAVQAQLGISN
mmetsp:Transcript_37874/g.107008  ORF Transcript_37874/g.107008 Transcript_37874/m.107008 type:complete len:85 (+) Transcript_37874:388-642(+)